MRVRSILLAAATVAATVAPTPAAALAFPAAAHAAGPGGSIAFVRDGDIWLTRAGKTTRITQDKGNSWPRLSPDGYVIAYTHKGNIRIATIADEPFSDELTHGGDAGGASWSPDGTYLAYKTGDTHTGNLTFVRLSSSLAVESTRTVRLKAAAGWTARRPESFDPLSAANTVAWSPDGKKIAFPGGDCWGIYDDCLTVLDVAANTEQTIVAFGGGGIDVDGFATTPSWSADSRKLFWTQQNDIEGSSNTTPVHSVAYNLTNDTMWAVGTAGDTIPVHLGGGAFLFTARHGGVPWIALDKSGTRTWLMPGAQSDWRP
ncbi:TolB-like translocation protein [Hamadaea tsunoensis]|uniref:PD40 domain-containing protein n=1 Tax=Hamadaea tsunoensis TaxID=53368 RepID=UPI00041AD74D|nr:PD40 domain-containing protein [Hamadaea tsunoensis]